MCNIRLRKEEHTPFKENIGRNFSAKNSCFSFEHFVHCAIVTANSSNRSAIVGDDKFREYFLNHISTVNHFMPGIDVYKIRDGRARTDCRCAVQHPEGSAENT